VDDVIAMASTFMKNSANAASLKPQSAVIDLDLDSIDLSAFASELTQKSGAAVDVATLINASDLTELSDVINAQGGGLPDASIVANAQQPVPAIDTSMTGLPHKLRAWRADDQSGKGLGDVESGLPASKSKSISDSNEDVVARRTAKRNAHEVKWGCLWPWMISAMRVFCFFMAGFGTALLPVISIGLIYSWFCHRHEDALIETTLISVIRYGSSSWLTTFSVFFTSFVSVVLLVFPSALAWCLFLKWAVNPRLKAGDRYEKWSMTWLRITCVQDFSDPYQLVQMFANLMGRGVWFNYMLRLMGLRVSLTATIQPEMCLFLTDCLPFLHLVEVEDDVLMENYIIMSNVTGDEQQEYMYTVKPLHFECGCSVLHQSRISAGTRLGRNSVLAPRSFAQGYVPDNCAVINCDVVDEKTLEARPMLKGCLAAGIPRRPRHHQHAGWMLRYAILALAILFELAMVTGIMGTYSVHRYRQILETSEPDIAMSISYFVDLLLLLTTLTHIRPALLVVAAKWLVIGKQQPGEIEVTDGLIMQYWFFDVVHGLYDLNYGHLVQMRFISNFTPIVNLYYAAMGARIPWSVILSAMGTAQTTRSLELLDFYEEVYLAAEVVFRTHMVLWSPDDGKQRIVYQPITMKREAFLGPNSSVMPGTTMEPRAGLMEGSLLPAQGIVKTGTAVVGTGQRMPFKHDRETVPSDSIYAYHVRMTLLLVLVRAPLVFIPMLLSVALGISVILLGASLMSTFIENISDLDMNDDFNASLVPVLLAMPFCIGARGVMQSYIGTPSMGIATIFTNKLLMFGLAQEGAKYPYRGWAHSRWATAFALTRPMYMSTYFDPGWKNGTKISDFMWWIAGVKIGRFSETPMKFPAQPEISMIEIGDYSCVNSITYGHAFGSGYLGFQRVRIGNGVSSSAFLISPGSTVVDGATISPLVIVSKIQEIKEPGQTVCGILPRLAQCTEGEYNGVFIAAGTKVQPWRFHEVDDDNDLELGHGKAASSKAAMTSYQKPLSIRRSKSHPCRSSLAFCLLLSVFMLPCFFTGLIVLPFMHDMSLSLKAEASVKPLIDSYHRFEAALHLKETHHWADVHRWAEQGYASGRIPTSFSAETSRASWLSPALTVPPVEKAPLNVAHAPETTAVDGSVAQPEVGEAPIEHRESVPAALVPASLYYGWHD
jgi:acetyltransferase-like isoleucine patch superfamily enzyme/aryl carrier-like protein